MEQNINLRNCPCCKAAAELHTRRDEARRRNPSLVKCSGCGLQTAVYDRVKDAIAAWNRRDGEMNVE